MDQEIYKVIASIKEELSEIKLLHASLLRKVIANGNSTNASKLPITYTLGEVAQIMHITKKGLRKKIEKGEINYIPGRVPLITEKQLFDYFKRLQPRLTKNDLM